MFNEAFLDSDDASNGTQNLRHAMVILVRRYGTWTLALAIRGTASAAYLRSNYEEQDSKGDVFVPHLVSRMVTGKGKNGPVPSSVSEGAALPLWDKISSSIRLRPTVSPAISPAGSALPPCGPQRIDSVKLAIGAARQ